MPAFVFVTGYLSRSFAWTRRRLLAAGDARWPCRTWCSSALYALFRIQVGGEQLEDLFVDPHWPMWYLAALFVWRLATPVLQAALGVACRGVRDQRRRRGSTPASSSTWRGWSGCCRSSCSGLNATPERLERLRVARGPGSPAAGCCSSCSAADRLVDALAGTGVALLPLPLRRARRRRPRRRMLIRLCFLRGRRCSARRLPRAGPAPRRLVRRMAGRWTLVVYLFHGFAVKGLGYSGFGDWSDDHTVLGLAVTTGLGDRGRPAARLGPAGPAAQRRRGPLRVGAALAEASDGRALAGSILTSTVLEVVYFRTGPIRGPVRSAMNRSRS